ncbi:hypothetical protein GCM10017750_05040 [Streptomyces racemochromogenes]
MPGAHGEPEHLADDLLDAVARDVVGGHDQDSGLLGAGAAAVVFDTHGPTVLPVAAARIRWAPGLTWGPT